MLGAEVAEAEADALCDFDRGVVIEEFGQVVFHSPILGGTGRISQMRLRALEGRGTDAYLALMGLGLICSFCTDARPSCVRRSLFGCQIGHMLIVDGQTCGEFGRRF